MPTLKVRGVDICYAAPAGAVSGRTVVLVHGATGHHGRWQHQIEALAAAGQAPVALDLPGHGSSGANPCDQVFLYREWLKQFTDALGLTRFVLAGHSMGGAIAQDFALAYPGCLEGLILISTGARLRVDPQRLEAYRQGVYQPEWARGSFAPGAPAALVAEAAQEALRVPPALRYADFLACDRFDALVAVGRLELPALVICGEDDIATPVKFSRYLAEQIKGSRLVLIPQAGHMVLREQPAAVNAAILAFLKELG